MLPHSEPLPSTESTVLHTRLADADCCCFVLRACGSRHFNRVCGSWAPGSYHAACHGQKLCCFRSAPTAGSSLKPSMVLPSPRPLPSPPQPPSGPAPLGFPPSDQYPPSRADKHGRISRSRLRSGSRAGEESNLFWSPYNKDPTIWGPILGSPIFGNPHMTWNDLAKSAESQRKLLRPGI